MIAGYTFHERHKQHVVVDGQITLFENWSELKLVRSYLVMSGLTRDGEFQGLNFQILHKGLYAIRYCAEVVVVHLLVLCAFVSH